MKNSLKLRKNILTMMCGNNVSNNGMTTKTTRKITTTAWHVHISRLKGSAIVLRNGKIMKHNSNQTKVEKSIKNK